MRLLLESYYFFDMADTQVRQSGMLKAYNTAVLCLQSILKEDLASNLLLRLPYDILRAIYISMAVLSDVLRSACVHDINFEAGQRLFHSGIAAVRKASVENNDMPGRLSVIMAQLWRKRNAKSDAALEEPRLRVKSRLGASQMYNWLWYWRELFAGQENAYGLPPRESYFPW